MRKLPGILDRWHGKKGKDNHRLAVILKKLEDARIAHPLGNMVVKCG